uniref:Uncharacterized protein n=1 Tax=Phytophthora ramorum TaxID=164328 RepID=H3H055_PHYRM
MSTPTTSSSKTPAASATASAVVVSRATTAAASATTASGIASTAMPTSAATESRLSVAGYHSRWHEKHAIRNKTGKIIAVETGVGIYSPGGEGVPLDYGSEVEEGELEGDKDTLSPGHTDPNVGLRRPREDDSNASGSKRSRSGSGTPLAAAGALTTPRDGDDSAPSAVVAASRTEPVREPWMPSQSEIGSRFVRITERDVNGYTSMCVPDDLKTLRASFQAQASSSAADNRSTYPSAVGDYSARPSFTPFGGGGGGGLRHSVIPTYRVGEEILSNEYENEPDLGSGSDDQQFAGRSSELPRSRLEAVERLQASQFAALRQELSLLKAQLAEVAQTTSNVKVEVGTRLSGALKRVAALEGALASHQT